MESFSKVNNKLSPQIDICENSEKARRLWKGKIRPKQYLSLLLGEWIDEKEDEIKETERKANEKYKKKKMYRLLRIIV